MKTRRGNQPWKPRPWPLGSQLPGTGTPAAPHEGWRHGSPLTQQRLPRGFLWWLLAVGPEVALGISDLEAGLLPDGGGGTWGKPRPPQWRSLLWAGRRGGGATEGTMRGTDPGGWGWGASTASFLSPKGPKKVGAWVVRSSSSQGPPSQGSPVEERGRPPTSSPSTQGTWLMLLGEGG